MKFLPITLILVAFGLSIRAQEKSLDSSTVNKLDIEKYMGRWYEVARLDHPRERGLVGVTATYTLSDDNQVKVVNSGYDSNKRFKRRSIEGKANVINSTYPGHFRVTFFMIASSDYYVLELDNNNYSYALIGNGKPNHLWVLSRTPTIERGVLNMLINSAKRRGYDTSGLIMVDQQLNEIQR